MTPAFSARSLSSRACLTSGSNQPQIIFTCGSILSPRNSNNGQRCPIRALVVMICWAVSNAPAKDPQTSSVAEPLGPMALFLGSGNDAESVSKLFPNKNSDAASRVNREYRSCALHGWFDALAADKIESVRVLCRSKRSKSDMRSRAKNGWATARCCKVLIVYDINGGKANQQTIFQIYDIGHNELNDA